MITTASNRNLAIREMVESAILIGIATMINEFIKMDAPWAFGGSITGQHAAAAAHRLALGHQAACSAPWSFPSQLLLGVKNVTYGQTAIQMVGITLLDYVVAYTVSWPGRHLQKAHEQQAAGPGSGHCAGGRAALPSATLSPAG